ncbi:MAG: hypothetical protein A2074_03835 [Candidatus Aquicultor primus]|uniref:Carboxypeptidase regulatory-like domain-containing protein n=1 Tax=Candidatus Aquicultor primus TaxID=1797195 RepID=A0A1F2UJ40_9ACTN|nr:MAG: hypothetical protein A2074_03835 [Candidatus Aquicultor primus]HCG98708.1 hypothetical protein [Actinomycetota bacterium]
MRIKSILGQHGSAIAEMLIAISILVIAATALIPLFVLGSKTAYANQIRTVAYNTAVEEIEHIKSLSYDDIGTVGRNPVGSLPADKERTVQNIVFQIVTNVRWVDDPDDGLVPNDLDGRDYKKATVTLTWKGVFGTKSLELSTFITRESEDQPAIGGNIQVNVKKSNGDLISDARVDITSGPSSPLSDLTDENGKALFLTLDESLSADDYSVTVSKSGYVVRPNLAVQHTTVSSGQIQVLEFIMDEPGILHVRLVDPFGALVGKNSRITLSNADAGILEYQSHSGYFEIPEIYPGIWAIMPWAASYESPAEPTLVDVKSLQTNTIEIPMQPKPQGLLYLQVFVDGTSDPVSNAQVTLTNLESSIISTGYTNSQGILELQIEAGNCSLAITKDGYSSHSEEIAIPPSGNTSRTVYLAPVPEVGSILVRCERTNGNPRNNVWIWVHGDYFDATIRTGDYLPGEALFDNLTPGSYTVHRWSSGWQDLRTVTATANGQTSVVYRY